MRLTALILSTLLIAGCAIGAKSRPQPSQIYRLNMDRAAAQAALIGGRFLVSLKRPGTGWEPGDVYYQAPEAALAFEDSHVPATVETCDVLWIGKRGSRALGAEGVWFDYLYFDAADKLIGFYRRFVD